MIRGAPGPRRTTCPKQDRQDSRPPEARVTLITTVINAISTTVGWTRGGRPAGETQGHPQRPGRFLHTGRTSRRSRNENPSTTPPAPKTKGTPRCLLPPRLCPRSSRRPQAGGFSPASPPGSGLTRAASSEKPLPGRPLGRSAVSHPDPRRGNARPRPRLRTPPGTHGVPRSPPAPALGARSAGLKPRTRSGRTMKRGDRGVLHSPPRGRGPGSPTHAPHPGPAPRGPPGSARRPESPAGAGVQGTPGAAERGRSERQPVPAGGFMAGGCAPSAPPSARSAPRCLSGRRRPPPRAPGPQQPGPRRPPPARPLNAGRARAPKERARAPKEKAHARPSSAHTPEAVPGQAHAIYACAGSLPAPDWFWRRESGTFEGRFHGNHSPLAPGSRDARGSFCPGFCVPGLLAPVFVCARPVSTAVTVYWARCADFLSHLS